MAKKIGIVGTMDDEVFGVDMKTMFFASQFGDVHIITPDTPVLDLDLLIMRGGTDIAPFSYGAKPGYILRNSNPYLEEFDGEKLPKYIEKKTPIFGICRGMQSINVCLGGTLFQHITKHPTNDPEDRESTSHKVKSLINKKEKAFEVNSMHHQAIDEPGEGIIVTHMALDKNNYPLRIIEAIRHTTLPIIGVQWHPEEIFDDFSIDSIKTLLK